MREEEPLKIALRQQLLLQMKISNKQLRNYILEESEFSEIIVTKLGFYFSSLPREVELLSNLMVTSQYPEEEDTRYMA